mmetsp:Transcript_20139/g.55492  ORF Transcript_20139/g.55492 Transcript_20139/m.55492 type:complete len:203 (-) Transcript_20139:949-1557(-)
MVATRSEALPPTTRTAVASKRTSVRRRSHLGNLRSHSATLRLLPVIVADMRASYLCAVTASGFARACSKASTTSKLACPIAAMRGVRPLNMQGRSGTFCFKVVSIVVAGSAQSSRTAPASPENAAQSNNEHPVFFASSSSCALQWRTVRNASNLLPMFWSWPMRCLSSRRIFTREELAPKLAPLPESPDPGRPHIRTSRCSA